MEEERVEVRTRPRPPLPAPQQRAVDEFWMRRQEEIEATVDFREHMLPMARLRKVIRATEEEEDGMMISADTPAFLSKLCEIFVQELAVRAWACAESHNRRIILDSDIAEAVESTEYYDFLIPVLLQHMHEVAQARRATPATARLVTRKRHRPDPEPRRRRPARVLPVTPAAPPAPPSSLRYVPFPFPCVLREGATPSVDERMLPAPPMNYATRGRVFFRNGNSSGNTFTAESSAGGMVRSPAALAGTAGELQPNAPPAAYYFCPYPVTDSDEAFAVGNTDPSRNIGIPGGNADGNGDDVVGNGISDGGQQLEKQSENADGHGERVVVVQQSSDVHAVQDAVSGVLGEADNESPMYMLLEEVLVDEDLLFPDADLFPPVGAPPDFEDFIIDQHVLDDVFADPSSSSSNSSN
uniref:Uncharacterized protein n=2 Tax=Avena sativa TaxID=4498 RepID=A0ACD6A0G4_AVESA